MVQYSNFGGVRVPSPADDASIPADLLDLVNQFCGAPGTPARAIQAVQSITERDANYDGFVGIVYCVPLRTVWWGLGKSGNAQQWRTIYVNSGWITSGFQYGDNFSAYSNGSVRVRRVNSSINMRVQVTYNGTADIRADNYSDTWPGNIPDATVLTQVPTDYLPPDEQGAIFFSTYTDGAALLTTTGQVKLRSMNTNSRIAPANTIQMQFRWDTND